MRGALRHLRWMARHPLGRARPLAAWRDWAAWQARSRLCKARWFPWVLGLKVAAAPGLHGMTVNVGVGLSDFAGMGFVLHYLRQGDRVVDVGANAGSYTLLAAWRGARVTAVEPNPYSRGFLERSLQLNGLTAQVVGVALCEREGAAIMDLSGDATGHLVEAAGQSTTSVQATTLDALVGDDPPRLLKIDVEGAELRVLQGATAALPHVQAIIVESWGKAAVHEALASAGFAPCDYSPFERRLSPWERKEDTQNVLFLRDPEAARRRVEESPEVTLFGRRF